MPNADQNELTQNFATILLLFHSFQKIQLESVSILPNTLAVALFANILVYATRYQICNKDNI
jgi:hypothetical protein